MKNRYMLGSFLAVLLVGSMYAAPAWAKDALLAKTEVLSENNKLTAELWGNKQDNGYADNLLVVLKRADGTILTGYKPSIKGGYGGSLQALQVKDKQSPNEQVLLALHQGDWRTYSEYRLLDISDKKAIKEIFTDVDSFGVVVKAQLKGHTLLVQTVRDQEPLQIELEAKMVEDISSNRRQLSFGKLQSLACIDVDNDGVKELLTNQQIMVDKRVLADVGAVWQYIGPKHEVAKAAATATSESQAAPSQTAEQKAKAKAGETLAAIEQVLQELKTTVTMANTADGNEAAVATEKPVKLWKQENLTIMKADLPQRKNTINNGVFFTGGMVYPVKMVSPQGEATYPQVMLNDKVDLEPALNKLLEAEAQVYVKAFLRGRADLAFNVLRADEKLLTLELISGKDSFVRHYINIIPGEKKKLALSDILDMHRKKDLVELLNVLNTNSKITWDANLTEEWYLRDDTLYLVKNIAGTDVVSAYALKNLTRYIKDKRFQVGDTSQAETKSEQKGSKNKPAAPKGKK